MFKYFKSRKKRKKKDTNDTAAAAPVIVDPGPAEADTKKSPFKMEEFDGGSIDSGSGGEGSCGGSCGGGCGGACGAG